MAFIWSFICKVCGPSQEPCEHAMKDTELRELRDMRDKMHHCCKFIEGALKEIIHILNRPQSATLKFSGGTMPATIPVGGTTPSLFQEWTGPGGTGTVVPNAGPIAYTSDNPAVATVDPASGVPTGVSVGTANISGTDQVNGLVGTGLLTVVAPPPPPAVSATLTFP